MQSITDLTGQAQTHIDKYKKRLRDEGYLALSNIMRDIHNKAKDQAKTYDVFIIVKQFAVIEQRSFEKFSHRMKLKNASWEVIHTVATTGRRYASDKEESEKKFQRRGSWHQKITCSANNSSICTEYEVYDLNKLDEYSDSSD